MIDTHCHLLHGLDDGPATAAEALALGERLAADGVETVVCTPHLSRRYPTDRVAAGERLGELRRLLADAGIPLSLELAAEVADATALSEPLEELAERAIGGRFVLVEVQPDARGVFLETVTARLAEAGLAPILAHPERSRAVQADPGLVDPARHAGALVQVVAPSVVGRWGEAVERAAWRLVQTGRADLLASDAHGIERRICRLREAALAVEARLGPHVSAALTRTRPAAVLRGERPG